MIRATADDVGAAGFDDQFGDGRINVWSAVQAAVGSPEPPPPPTSEEPPVASFTYSCTDLSCDFTDTSTDDGGVEVWAWDFGDGSASPTRDPSHEYVAAGDYTVTLTVTDALDQSDAAQQVVTVTEPPPPPPNQPPSASFTVSCTGLACDFTDTSTDDGGIVARLWDFGDGGWSDEQSPSYTYWDPGTYTVSLLVEDAESELDLASQEITVIELPPVLSASANKVKGVLVTDLSWTGTRKGVDLYRDGGLIAAGVPSDPGTYQDFTGERGKATFSYVACIAGTTTCSDPVAVVY
jgi:PKD repeat protein